MKFGRCLWVVERDLDSCSVLSLYDWKMTIYRFVRNVGWCREECYKERPEIAARICTHFLCPQGSFLRWGRLLDARVHWYGKMMRTLVDLLSSTGRGVHLVYLMQRMPNAPGSPERAHPKHCGQGTEGHSLMRLDVFGKNVATQHCITNRQGRMRLKKLQ